MTVRAKMRLASITDHHWGAKELTFRAEYDESLPEDQRFAKATPSGEIKMHVDNPAALDQFALGQSYYVDFNAVPAPAADAAEA